MNYSTTDKLQLQIKMFSRTNMYTTKFRLFTTRQLLSGFVNELEVSFQDTTWILKNWPLHSHLF